MAGQTKRYDVLVVGAGPAGLLAAKALGEHGLDVALLEKRRDPVRLTRACGQTLVSMNEYIYRNLSHYNARDKRVCFPVEGFSFTYDGPWQNIYGVQIWTPNGHKVQLGDLPATRKLRDYGRVAMAFDKELLTDELIHDVRSSHVAVMPGVSVDKVGSLEKGVRVEVGTDTYEASYLIAANGVNSGIAESLGFNEGRAYYCNLWVLLYYMKGVEPPEPDVIVRTTAFFHGSAASMWIVPRCLEGESMMIVMSLDPRVDLKEATQYFMTQGISSAWFRRAKQTRTFSAVCDCYSPIMEPCRGRVLVAGDAGSTQELENTGAMLSGWKAGQAVATAIQEEKLGLPVTGTRRYAEWWKDAYAERYNHETYMKGYALPYILNSEEDMNYVMGLLKEPLPACFNPYSPATGEAMKKAAPLIQRDRPDIMQKLQRRTLPVSELLAELTQVSKPVFD